jgi:hypothetical protein
MGYMILPVYKYYQFRYLVEFLELFVEKQMVAYAMIANDDLAMLTATSQ